MTLKANSIIVLALTATTSHSGARTDKRYRITDRQTLQGRGALPNRGRLYHCQDILSFPAILTFNQGGHYTGLWGPTWCESRSGGPEYGVWQREPVIIIPRIELCFTAIPRKADFDGRVKLAEAIQLTTPTASLVLGHGPDLRR